MNSVVKAIVGMVVVFLVMLISELILSQFHIKFNHWSWICGYVSCGVVIIFGAVVDKFWGIS